MAACNFSIPFSGDAASVLAKAKTAVQGQGGHFEGDQGAGNFDVSVFGSLIAGSYAVSDQQLHITIESKPFLVPCSTIESFMKNQVS